MTLIGKSGSFLVDHILDRAGAKGTGKWMSQLALDLGVPSTLVTEAVYARCLSAEKDARVRASSILSGPKQPALEDPDVFIGTGSSRPLCIKNSELRARICTTCSCSTRTRLGT